MLEKEVENALDDLEATGALQRANRMAIEDILNPIKEINCEFESSDEDICRAVLDTRKAREDMLINGGDDDVDDNADSLAMDTLSHKEFLRLSASITTHLHGMNDLTARRIEADLAAISRQMRRLELDNMGPTQITDYFTRI
ncbi:hypothetical protein C0991_000713 [Blastosporella zonata]|nr:hypothetical protein C0991_000713 [Blastosporella zonata]